MPRERAIAEICTIPEFIVLPAERDENKPFDIVGKKRCEFFLRDRRVRHEAHAAVLPIVYIQVSCSIRTVLHGGVPIVGR
jgi:hypothetical protein